MRIRFHKKFRKKYQKLRAGERRRCDERLRLFSTDTSNAIFRRHRLHGKYRGYQSIDIGGDLRAVFKIEDETTAIFADIDTHHNLYE